jgi:hypothetical protein
MSITLGVVDIDAKGENGGTHFWCETPKGRFEFKITDKREAVHPEAIEAFNLVRSHLINSNA